MCGIWGYAGNISSKHYALAHDFLRNLAIESEVRGIDATGFAARYDSGHILVDKMPYRATVYSQMSPRFQMMRRRMPSTLIGHVRAGSGSSPIINNNNHPFLGSRYHLVHNGIIPSWRDLRKTHQVELKSETDSELIIRVIEKKLEEGKDLSDSIEWLLDNVWGNMACALLDQIRPDIYLFRNENPIYVFTVPHGIFGPESVLFFASTDEIFENAWKATFKNKSYKKFGVDSSFLNDNKMFLISTKAKESRDGNLHKFLVYSLSVRKKFRKSQSYSYGSDTTYGGYQSYSTSNIIEEYWSVLPNPAHPILGCRLDKTDSEKIYNKLANKDAGRNIKIDGMTVDEYFKMRAWRDELDSIDRQTVSDELVGIVSDAD